MIYYGLFTFIMFCSIFMNNSLTIDLENEIKIIKKQKNSIKEIVLLILFATILIIFAGIRYNVGKDYYTYSIIQIPEVLSGITFRVELFYQYVIKIGYALAGTQGVFLLTHTIIVILLILAIRKNSFSYFWSFLVLFYGGIFSFSLSAMRQSIAIAIFLFAYQYIKKRKLFSYIICIIIAAQFHSTAYIFLPIYFLYGFSFNIIFCLGALIVYLLIINNLHTVINILGLNYDAYFVNKYASGSSLGLYAIPVILLVIIFTVTYFENKSITWSRDLYHEWAFHANILFILLLISMSFGVIPSAYRIYYMFLSLSIISVPLNLKLLNLKDRAYIGIIIFIGFLGFFTVVYYLYNGLSTMPYHSIFGGF